MNQLYKLMSVQEFAKEISKTVPIGLNKIYKLAKEPGFPSIKIGGRFYVLIDKVNEWLEKKAFSENKEIIGE